MAKVHVRVRGLDEGRPGSKGGHIEYFKLKGFEKMAETGRLL